MTEDIKPDWKLDFEHYEKLLNDRIFYTNTNQREKFIIIYNKIYLYTTLTNSFTQLDRRSKVGGFFNECKNNLIISYDLANVNYINASKQLLRSAIESFFRLSLAISKYIEYKENVKQGIYSATATLRDLKRMQDTHKVGSLTRYVLGYYRDVPVEALYEDLYNIYSNLSSIVHVNKIENFTPHRYLEDYIRFNQGAIELHLAQLIKVIDNIIQIIYYFSFSLVEEGIDISKRNLVKFEHSLDDNSYLDLIDEYFNSTSVR